MNAINKSRSLTESSAPTMLMVWYSLFMCDKSCMHMSSNLVAMSFWYLYTFLKAIYAVDLEIYFQNLKINFYMTWIEASVYR